MALAAAAAAVVDNNLGEMVRMEKCMDLGSKDNRKDNSGAVPGNSTAAVDDVDEAAGASKDLRLPAGGAVGGSAAATKRQSSSNSSKLQMPISFY